MYTGVKNGAVQTGYFVGPPQGVPGQITFPEQTHIVNSYPVESEFIYCGRGVVKGTDIVMPVNKYGNNNSPFTVELPTAASLASEFIGILTRDHGARNDAAGEAGKQFQDMAGIMEEGFIFVPIYQPTVAHGTVYMVIDATNGLNAPIGAFTNDDVGGKAIEIPRLRWWATYNNTNQPCGIVQIFSK